MKFEILLEKYHKVLLDEKLITLLSSFFKKKTKQISDNKKNLIYSAVFKNADGKVKLTMNKDGVVKLNVLGNIKKFHDLDQARKFLFKHAPKLRIDHTIARLRGN